MDYLQYFDKVDEAISKLGFKPYYKWITFNTPGAGQTWAQDPQRFKPYYKWITFNTMKVNYKKLITLIGF